MRLFYPAALQTILLSPLSTRAFVTSKPTAEVIISALSLFESNELPPPSLRGVTHHHPSIINNRRQISYCRMASTSSSSQDTTKKNLVVDPFCFRQFAEKENSRGYAGAVLYVIYYEVCIFVIILLLLIYICIIYVHIYY